jgi:DNA polymerase
METGVATRLRNLLFRRDGSALVITLPSGRPLCYHSMKVEGSKMSYLVFDQNSRKWTRIETYYGKLAENVTQAVARDVLAEGMLAVENDGMRIVLTVHDEVIAEAPDTDDFPEWRMSRLLATAPKWAKGLPLAAKGNVCYRYTKG